MALTLTWQFVAIIVSLLGVFVVLYGVLRTDMRSDRETLRAAIDDGFRDSNARLGAIEKDISAIKDDMRPRLAVLEYETGISTKTAKKPPAPEASE